MIHIDFKTKNQMAGSAPISMRIIYHTSLERVGESRTGYRREGQGGMQVDCCFQSQLHSVLRSTLLLVGRVEVGSKKESSSHSDGKLLGRSYFIFSILSHILVLPFPCATSATILSDSLYIVVVRKFA